MNDTSIYTNSDLATDENILGNPYLTITFGVLLIVSEILPLLKNKSNGLVHSIICLLKGSSCFTKKLADVIEANCHAEEKENSNNKV